MTQKEKNKQFATAVSTKTNNMRVQKYRTKKQKKNNEKRSCVDK